MPQYPYALSKYQGEQAVFHWNKVYKLPANSIRIFNAYGTRSRTSGAYGAVFGVFLKQKLAGKPFTVVGDGTQTRDFLYVTDIAQAFLRAAQTEKVGEVWNLGAGNPQSVNRLVELLDGPVVYIPKHPGEPDCTWADITKIRRELKWGPTVSFEDGVARIMANIEYWREAPLWDPEVHREGDGRLVQRAGVGRSALMDDASKNLVSHKVTSAQEIARLDRRPTARQERDYVSWHVRHRAPRPCPPPALRQEQG